MTNEERILQMLLELNNKVDNIQGTVNEHSKILNEYSKMLNEHGKILKNLQKTQDEHSKMLYDLQKTQDNHGKMLEEIRDNFIELEAKNAKNHLEVYNLVTSLSKDVKFMKHKLHETEEDVFDIKDRLRLVK